MPNPPNIMLKEKVKPLGEKSGLFKTEYFPSISQEGESEKLYPTFKNTKVKVTPKDLIGIRKLREG